MKIFIYAHLCEPAKAYLRAELAPFQVHWADKHAPTASDQEQFADCDVCFGNVPADWLTGKAKLRWMQLESVGFEYYQKIQTVIHEKKIVLTNLRGMFAWPAAETALAGLLGLLRGMDEVVLAQPSHNWISLDVRPRMGLLHGRKALIFGIGSIGRRTGHLLRAFECEVKYFARSDSEADFHNLKQVDAHLGEFTVVINCLPSTPETANVFNRERLARFSRDAIFVNVGRGSAVDEEALVEVLRNKRIGGAVLDVFREEPLPSHHPLWDCSRTIILQHTGGGYADELLDKAKVFINNLELYRRGQPLSNQIDLKRGY